jgi:haloacetate dehalogenase
MHAMCEDYRAAASIDLIHDRADRDAAKKLQMPLRVLWGERGLVAKCFSPIEDWKRVAEDVSGKALPCGHYIPEELPLDLLAQTELFFA